MEKKELQEASVGMALMDALPVLCFCGTIACLTRIWKSPLFLIGGILCIAAGFGKVVWKGILAVTKRNIDIWNRQFRYLMSGGFALILLSLVIDNQKIDLALVWKYVTWFPGNLCFLAGSLGMVLMGVLAGKLDASSKKANWIEQSVNLVAQLSILLGVVLIWYGSDTYGADETACKAMESTSFVSVQKTEEGLFFDGEGEEAALVFYPGAKVELSAYAPLMKRLAEEGMDAFLVEMPYHMALFGKDKAADLMERYPYKRWYIGGHSLGGAMAASFAAETPDGLSGVVLLAAYPTKSLDIAGLEVLSLYGSEDGVLNMEKMKEGQQYLPKGAVTYCIEGGNHAGFGSYGRQDGDKNAKISQEEQWEITVEQIKQMETGR